VVCKNLNDPGIAESHLISSLLRCPFAHHVLSRLASDINRLRDCVDDLRGFKAFGGAFRTVSWTSRKHPEIHHFHRNQRGPRPGELLKRFESIKTESDVLRFASTWGPLGICICEPVGQPMLWSRRAHDPHDADPADGPAPVLWAQYETVDTWFELNNGAGRRRAGPGPEPRDAPASGCNSCACRVHVASDPKHARLHEPLLHLSDFPSAWTTSLSSGNRWPGVRRR